MKAKPYQISALTSQIQSQFQGALIFGIELGIIQEVSEKIEKIILKNMASDINLIKITPSKIKEIPSILTDEGNVASFFGGRRLIWLKDADDAQTEVIKDYFNTIKTDTFLLISCGNLNKNSELRSFCEAHPKILTVVCYPEDERAIGAYIQNYLRENGIKVQSDALAELINRLSGNRLQAVQELNKLINYLGDKKSVDLNTVSEVITDTQEVTKDVFCESVALGKQKQAIHAYQIMLENGENPVAIVRILYSYFNKLLDGNEIAAEQGVEVALKKMLRPAQFRQEPAMRQQLQIWKKSHIINVLDFLIQTEQEVKATGIPAELLLERVVIQITNVAKRNM